MRIYYIISSLANSIWIFLWHYKLIPLSVILMLVILFSLIKIADETKRKNLTIADNFFVRIPFGIYFGWITVATIANITVLLVSIGWNGFGISQSVWTIIILLIGSCIGIARLLRDQNIVYALVLVWAYFGIWSKHTSLEGFNREYPTVILTTIICMIIFILVSVGIAVKGKLLLGKNT